MFGFMISLIFVSVCASFLSPVIGVSIFFGALFAVYDQERQANEERLRLYDERLRIIDRELQRYKDKLNETCLLSSLECDLVTSRYLWKTNYVERLWDDPFWNAKLTKVLRKLNWEYDPEKKIIIDKNLYRGKYNKIYKMTNHNSPKAGDVSMREVSN